MSHSPIFAPENRDPFVAKRVKVLSLCMGYFKHDVGKNKQLKRYLLGQYKQKHTPTFKDTMSSLISIVPLLSNVYELEIELWYAPSDVLAPLFQAIHTSFGKRLDRLLIRANLDGIWALVGECAEKFEHLKGLHVELMNRLSPANQRVDMDENTLVCSVAPFIKSLAPTLEVLRIWTWASVDFSRFYDVLATSNFPALKSVYIRMAFNDMLRQPESLQAFLSGCGCTLEKLELRLNNSRGMQLGQSNEEPLGKWLEDFVGKESDTLEHPLSFPKLQALDFYPSTAESGTTALLSIIHRSADTLLELTIRDRYFYPDQARTLINAAAKCKLRYFRMNVMHLDIELLDLVMEKLPDLEKIWFSLSKVMGSGEVDLFIQLFSTLTYIFMPAFISSDITTEKISHVENSGHLPLARRSANGE